MIEINHTWTSTGSSGGLTPLYVDFPPLQSALMCQFSTLASTQSIALQTAQESSGPWFTEASTSISTAVSGQVVMRLTGPYTWVRPYLNSASTGTYQIRLIGGS